MVCAVALASIVLATALLVGRMEKSPEGSVEGKMGLSGEGFFETRGIDGAGSSSSLGEGEDGQVGQMVEGVQLGGVPQVGSKSGSGSWEVSLSLPDAGSQLIQEYQELHDCSLVRSGYLDLFGNVWGMAVQGAGWSEVCVIQEKEGDQSCVVTLFYMDATEWVAPTEAQ